MASQSQINQPNVQGTLTNAFTTIENQPQKILVVGQKISGTATAGALVENVQNNNLELIHCSALAQWLPELFATSAK